MTFQYQLLNNFLSLPFKLAKFTCISPLMPQFASCQSTRFAAQTENVYQRSQSVKIDSQQWSCTGGARRTRPSVYHACPPARLWLYLQFGRLGCKEPWPGCKVCEEISTRYLQSKAKEQPTGSSSQPQVVNCFCVW